jgi:cyclophilin family peptidyl-prolyl cis-trans isomerase
MYFKGLKKLAANVSVIGLFTVASATANVALAQTSSMKNIDTFIAGQNVDKSNKSWKLNLNKPPKQSFKEGKSYYWKLATNVGNIEVKLLPKVAPMHVTSTIYLTQLGFYDNIVFHRVIKDFMAQGGDPTGTGRAGPGYTYDGEFSNTVRHNRPGLLSMANSGPGTDGSQFFLTFIPTAWLNGKHTIFGEVTAGMDTVNTLESAGSKSGKTSKRLVIEKATIEVR